ncbi:hypothetical protein CEXT_555961 [Caerostris extrusa]|uniref:Uncharacterized protein n=1 Tax=Caerostris extrusa TaxID=172846 RepID=A0AAV4TBC3_CAEEX|nr:hypothetical protein CEXT_555961 [Caerostris extrusa]
MKTLYSHLLECRTTEGLWKEGKIILRMRTEVGQQLVNHSDDDRNPQFAPRGFIVYGRHHRFFASLSHTTRQLALA